MLIPSNSKFILSFFFVLTSILLIVDSAELVRESIQLANKPVSETSANPTNQNLDNGKINFEEKENGTKPTDDSYLPLVTLEEVADEFILLSTSVLPKMDNHTISKVKIDLSTEIDGLWVPGLNKSDKAKVDKVSKAKAGDRGIFLWKVYPLKPGTKYRLFVSAFYGEKQLPEDIKPIEFTTKASAPKISITKRSPVITFDKKDVKSYHVQIYKIEKDGKESDCVFEISASSCLSNEFPIPEFTVGEKYSVKTWYVANNGVESKINEQEIS